MKGRILADEVQPGLLLSGLNLTYEEDYRLDVRMQRSVGCAVLLGGSGEALEVPGHAPVSVEIGRASVVGYGEPMICARPWRKGQRTRGFGVVIKPDFFERFPSAFDDSDLAALGSFLEPGFHSTILPRSARLLDIAETTLDGAYGGGLRALFHESQALRFTVEIVSLLKDEERLVRRLGRRQYDRVHHARELLDQALIDPPKLVDLARRLGVNVSTLQANFKAAFGTTIFGYVRGRRL